MEQICTFHIRFFMCTHQVNIYIQRDHNSKTCMLGSFFFVNRLRVCVDGEMPCSRKKKTHQTKRETSTREAAAFKRYDDAKRNCV